MVVLSAAGVCLLLVVRSVVCGVFFYLCYLLLVVLSVAGVVVFR